MERPPAAGDALARLGRFLIRTRVGAGAFGTVYRAYDPHLHREVALKVPLPGLLEDPRRAERFLREARAAAGLRHPHIVPLFEAGGRPPACYLASQFIEGRTLATLAADSPLDFRTAARITRQMAEALAYAHREEVVHRDVKPANIMVDAQGDAHLLDFGLAHREEGGERLTQDADLVGTPAYMAPERVGERRQEVLPASDQYSLGVILYELLCGRAPFDGPAEVVLFNALHVEPVPPRRLNPRVPLDLETVCLKAMAKRPPDRYPTCQELADDLRRWLEGEPVRARRLSLAERSARWCRRYPAVAALLALVVVVLVAGMSATSVFALVAQQQTREAFGQQQRAKEEAEKARRSAEEAQRRADAERKVRLAFRTLLLSIRDSEPLGFLGGYGTAGTATAEPNPLVRTLTARFPELLRDPPADPAARAALLDMIGDFYRNYGDLDKAEPLLREALLLRERELGKDNPDYAASLHSLAWLLHDRGDYAAAEDLYRRALALRQRLGDADGLDATRFQLAWLLLDMGDFEEAEELLHAVLEARKARDGDASRPVAVAKFALAGLALDRGRPDQTLRWNTEAVNTFIAIEGDKGLWHGVSLFQQGVVAKELPPLLRGDPEAKLKEALALIGRSLGENHPYNALVLHELAQYREGQKDDVGAERYYRQCLRVVEGSVGFGHPRVTIAVGNLARLLGRAHREAEADRLFEQLLKAHRERFGREHFLVADALAEQFFVLDERGDEADADRARGEAAAIYLKGDRLRGRYYVPCLNSQAVRYSRKKEYAKAQELLEKVLPQAQKQFGKGQPIVGRVLANLAFVKLMRGDTRGVEDYLLEAERCVPVLSFDSPQLLSDVLATYGFLYRRTGRLPEAEAVALRRRKAYPRDPEVLYLTACDLALLVPLAQEPAARKRYADQAMETLRQAVLRGWKDAGQLGQEPALAELRSRDDFKQLSSEVRAKRGAGQE